MNAAAVTFLSKRFASIAAEVTILSEQPARPRVLLADDDVGICTAVSRLLSASCNVVGCVSDSATLFESILRLQPDVVLLDFSLDGALTGIEVCRRLKSLMPEVNVVAFTADDDVQLRRVAQDAGASGFVWKPEAVRHLEGTIQALVTHS